jgi:hypothetical protein
MESQIAIMILTSAVLINMDESREANTPAGANVLNYEATSEDPKIFSRPWKISMPLYRWLEKDAQLLEFRCAEFVEELLYGPLRKHPSK